MSPLDDDDLPCAGCPQCGNGSFWKPASEPARGSGWRCARCSPRPPDVPAYACVLPSGRLGPEPPPDLAANDPATARAETLEEHAAECDLEAALVAQARARRLDRLAELLADGCLALAAAEARAHGLPLAAVLAGRPRHRIRRELEALLS